jgi:hypothetical protein
LFIFKNNFLSSLTMRFNKLVFVPVFYALSGTNALAYFTFSTLRKGRNKIRVFLPGNPFQPCLILERKAKSLPKRGAPEIHSARVGRCLTGKYQANICSDHFSNCLHQPGGINKDPTVWLDQGGPPLKYILRKNISSTNKKN